MPMRTVPTYQVKMQLDCIIIFLILQKLREQKSKKHDAFLKARNEIKEYFKYFVIENLI